MPVPGGPLTIQEAVAAQLKPEAETPPAAGSATPPDVSDDDVEAQPCEAR